MNRLAPSSLSIKTRWSKSLLPPCGVLLLLATTPAMSAEPPAPQKLNDPLVEGGVVSTERFSPDGEWVVYTAEQDTSGVTELFSVPVGGGEVVKLNQPLVAGGDVSNDIEITPDSSTVVFRADALTDNARELFSVPISGGPVTRLGEPLPAGGGVFTFSLTPDGLTVIYVGEQLTDGVTELFSVPVGGGEVTRLSPPGLGGGRNVLGTRRISADSSTVVYLADQNTNTVNELFAVPVGGGPVVQLNGPLPNGGGVGLFGFDISPDSSTVVYTADQVIDNRHELFSVPIGGGEFTRLNETTPDAFVPEFKITPNGTGVVFRTSAIDGSSGTLFSVAIAGGPVTPLNDPAHDKLFFFDITADSSRLVYQTSGDDVEELFSVPVAGGAVTRLNAPLPEGETVGSFELSEDGSRIVYDTEPVGDFETTPGTGLFSVPTAGGEVTPLTAPFEGVKGTGQFDISPDSRFVVFRADLETANVLDLFGVPIEGGTVLKLNGPMVEGGNVSDFRIGPTSASVIFRADKETNDVVDLFSVVTSGVLNTAPVAVTEFSVESATGTGLIQGAISGGGDTCTVSQANAITFDEIPDAESPGASFEHGLLDLVLDACNPGASVTVTLAFPAPLPVDTQLFKFGPTPDDPTPGLYVMPATISDSSVVYSIVDGGLGDDDLQANGRIIDPVGPGVAAASPPPPATAAGPVMSVPTLGQWALVLMALIMAGVGALSPRKRRIHPCADDEALSRDDGCDPVPVYRDWSS